MPKSQPLASIYVKFFGQEIAFANIDKAIVDQAVQVRHLVSTLFTLHTRIMSCILVHCFSGAVCERLFSVWTCYYLSHLQLSTSADAKLLLKDALKALQTGISVQAAKPLLAAEIRRIFPTAVGVPMELSLYSAAVAAATIKGRT